MTEPRQHQRNPHQDPQSLGDHPGSRPLSRAGAWLVATTALVVLVLDQVTKAAAVHLLADGKSVTVVNTSAGNETAGDLVSFRLVRNPGAAFSFGESHTWLFTTFALVVLVAVAVLLRTQGQSFRRIELVTCGLFCGGVTGNLIDRLVREPGFYVGHVVDFIVVGSWPTFNVADSAVVIAATLIVATALRPQR